jgi:iron complex outermembrane receptor protein
MSVSIRGIGSPITDDGVESSVSMVFDGVQTSRGILAQLGMFDVANVEVLKGPQALFFGKNSPAGVIAVNSNGPTDTWQGTRKRAMSSSPLNRPSRRHLAVPSPIRWGFESR